MALGAVLGGPAAATTGPGNYFLYPPRYPISLDALNPYLGRYASTSVARKSRITSSQIIIGVDETGNASGEIAIFGYDARGRRESLVLSLYNVHEVDGNLELDIVGIGGKPVLGHLSVHHAGSSRDLVGTIDPPGGGGSFRIRYGYQGHGDLLKRPTSKPAGGSPSSGGGARANGWGAAVAGRYRLVDAQLASSGAESTPAVGNAGLFSDLVQRALGASAGALPTGGQLTVTAGGGTLTLTPPAPGGELSLVDLVTRGSTPSATLQSAAGQTVGTLRIDQASDGRLVTTVTLDGRQPTRLTFAGQ